MEGSHTGDNDRFLRYFWESSQLAANGSEAWVPYARAAAYQKWAGVDWLVVDWRADGWPTIRSHVHGDRRRDANTATTSAGPDVHAHGQRKPGLPAS